MQCIDVCPEGDGWDSRIAISNREARSICITWMADPQTSLYVVQYRLRNTPVYTNSLEVRDPVSCVQDSTMCFFYIQISSTNYSITQLRPETDYEVQVCRATSTSDSDDCGNCLFCMSTIQARGMP